MLTQTASNYRVIPTTSVDTCTLTGVVRLIPLTDIRLLILIHILYYE